MNADDLVKHIEAESKKLASQIRESRTAAAPSGSQAAGSASSGELWERFARAEKRAISLWWQDQQRNSEAYRCWTEYTDALRQEKALQKTPNEPNSPTPRS